MGWWCLALLACAPPASGPTDGGSSMPMGSTGSAPASGADVVGVATTGDDGAFVVSVTVRSPDEGCDRYADWFELVTDDGELLHRRILNHSHVDEQPFTRSTEGPVELGIDQSVWVRAHLHPDGYGGTTWHGTARQGFRAEAMPPGFAEALATTEPLPTDCWF